MNFRSWWAAVAVCALPLLHACGGGSDGGAGAVRLVNATDDFASLDLYATDTLLSSDVATATAGAFVSVGASTQTLVLKRSGSSTTSSSSSRTVASGVSYTLVAYSTGEALKSGFLEESQPAPPTGSAKLRVFNASIEAGAVDVYVTAPDATLAGSSPTTLALGSERIGAYAEYGKGTYRIRVTGTGIKSDLRLDIPTIDLADQQIATLVLTSTPGGVLVHGLVINQKDTVAAQRNPSARLRLVASAAANGSVAAAANGTTLSSGSLSPSVGTYALVTAGALNLIVSINGTAVAAPPASLVAGSDTTLLVTGTVASPALTLLSDDNSPALSSANTKIRLVHGVSGLTAPISLLVDLGQVASDIALNSASTPFSMPATTASQLQVNTATSTLFDPPTTTFPLAAGHVYTMWMLGDSTTPVGKVLKDR